LDDEELDFSFSGPTRFDGLEQPAFLNCNPRALRQGYLEALNAFLAEIRKGCARHSVDYALLRTSQPLDTVLVHFLSSRMGARQRRA
jgi:hypothetical protein